MAFDYAGPRFDFSPLANLADPIIERMKEQRQNEALSAFLNDRLGGTPAPLAALGAPAAPEAPAAPAAPSIAGGGRQRAMVMPPEAYAPLIQQAAAEHKVEPELLTRLLQQESNFNPNALSPAGAMGVAQFMPGTAKRFGIDPTVPEQAIPAAAKYIAANRELFGGNTGLALAGYNWGEGNVQKWVQAGADPAKMPAETRNYVAKITGKPIEGWTGGTAVADLPIQGGANAQFAIPGSAPAQAAPAAQAAPVASVTPERRAALMRALQAGGPAAQLAMQEIHQLTQPKNPMSLGNGILYDPRTGKVQDFSNMTKQPEDYRNYQLEQQDPGYLARRREKETTAAPKPPGSKFTETTEKHYGDEFIDLQKQGLQASSNVGNLQAMLKLTDHPEFYSGTGSGVVTAFKRAAGAIGLGDVKAAAPNELFAKMTKRALIDTQKDGKMGAGFSNADRDFVEAAGANPNISTTANKAIIQMNIAAEQRKKEIASRAREYKKQHGIVDEGFYAELADWSERNPAFKGLDPAIFEPPAPPASRTAPQGYVPPGLPPPGTPSTGSKTSKGVIWSVQ